MFEEIIDENCRNTLVQNILNPKHDIDDNDKLLTKLLEKVFNLLDYFVISF
jgi:hypothetical protein